MYGFTSHVNSLIVIHTAVGEPSGSLAGRNKLVDCASSVVSAIRGPFADLIHTILGQSIPKTASQFTVGVMHPGTGMRGLDATLNSAH
jgi:hypothetical protein